VLLLEPDEGVLAARAAVGLEEEVERGVRIPVGRGFAGRIAAERVPVVLDDVDHADVLNPVLREKGVKSLLGVPLVVGNEMLGVLHVGTLTPRRFTPEDTQLLQLAGDRAEQGERLRRLIEQLLDLSRLDAKGITVEPRPLPLAETLAEIAAHAARETEVHVDAPAGVTALADPLVLDRVVSNLLANAVKHGEPPVRLGARVENDALLVTVEDAGRGIPAELVPRLFERFARGESNGGSGLGLAIAAAYAEAAGGTLAYARDENGTRFALTLPHQA